jgi:hypothetical protein
MNCLRLIPAALVALLILADPHNGFSAEKTQILCTGTGRIFIPAFNYVDTTGRETNSYGITNNSIGNTKCQKATPNFLFCQGNKIPLQSMTSDGVTAFSFTYVLDKVSGAIKTTTTQYFDRNIFANTFPRFRSQILSYQGEVYKRWAFEGTCEKAKPKF